MPDLEYEYAAVKRGDADSLSYVVGIDEAGRGPLAGPVSAAAVILPKGFKNDLLDDSKKLSEKKRDVIYEDLMADKNLIWGHSYVEADEIDAINILKATHVAMARAVDQLINQLDQKEIYCLIDGLAVNNFPYDSEGIVKGDGKSLSIAAASIIAKV